MCNPMVNYSDIIQDTVSKHWNVCDEFKDNLLVDNQAICKREALPFAVGIINVAGDLNVGMMIRTASLLGAEAVHIFGRKKFDKRSTVGAENYIDIVHHVYAGTLDPICDDLIIDDIQELLYEPVLVEQGGIPIGRYLYNGIGNGNIGKPIFIFGSESHGIPDEILNHFPRRISIPQRGVLRSYNVSAAMSIVCWDYIKTQLGG